MCVQVVLVWMLQLSRFFSKRKIVRKVRDNKISRVWLQWSRFFSKRKIGLTEGTNYVLEDGFNGAAFFQSGKSLVSGGKLTRETLEASMEPLFFKAENLRWGEQRCRREQGFNGAAFFQSGKL